MQKYIYVFTRYLNTWCFNLCPSSYVNMYYFFVYHIISEIFWMSKLYYLEFIHCEVLHHIQFKYYLISLWLYMFIILSNINALFIIILISFFLTLFKDLSSIRFHLYNGMLVLFFPYTLNNHPFHWYALFISPLLPKMIY